MTLLVRLDKLIRTMAAGAVTKEGSGVMLNQSATDFVRRFGSAQTRLVLTRSQVGSFYEAAAEWRGIPLQVTGTMPSFTLKQFSRDVARGDRPHGPGEFGAAANATHGRAKASASMV
jgi:hypothetical protein